MSKNKIHLPIYDDKCLKDLFKRLIFYVNCRDQWLESNHYSCAAEYQIKAETLLELLENIVCMSTGLGDIRGMLNKDLNCNFDHRVKSFSWIIKINK